MTSALNRLIGGGGGMTCKGEDSVVWISFLIFRIEMKYRGKFMYESMSATSLFLITLICRV